MSADIDAVATSRREPTSVSHGARYAGTAMACVALVLMLLQAMLYVASGWGVEDFLGWADPGPANAMLRVWDRIGVGGVAWAYLTLDSLVFVPVYTAFFAALALHLSDGLAPVEQAVRPARVLSGVLAAPLIALFVVDLVENGLGMARLHEWGWLAALATTIVAIGFLGRIGALKHLLARLGAWALVGAVALALVLLAVGWLQGNTCKLDGAVRSAGWIWPFGCAAHRAKQALTLLLILVMLLAVGAWLFGLGSAAHDIALREARARLRAAIGDMLLRSRYVLLALLALAGLTVAMDQGRDVVYAVAAAPYRDIANWRSWAGAFAVFAASASAVWLLVFACWLWTRSVCQLQAVHDTAAVAAAAGASPGLRPEDLFARDWARVLAMMPLLVLILLCAGVIRDTVTALSAADQAGNDASHALAIVTTVLVFGVVTLALGLLFIRWRRGKEETRYYDALSWQEWCERAGFATTAPAMQKLVGQKYSLAGLIDPYWLPVAALVGMLLCRLVGVAATPSDMASHIPTMTLPIIMFALALWLCFFGWLSLLEVRQAIPWVGLLIVLIGALGLLGLTDNHLVWPPITDAATAERGTLRMLGFTALLGVLLVGLYMWVMHVVKDMSGRIAGLTAAGRPRTLALWAPPPVLLLLMVGVIALADHDASSREPDPSAREATRPDLDQALARWLTSLCSAKADAKDCDRQGFGSDDDHEVYFVSTEGGGIRAAAWTALALQHFASTVPQFQARTFSISGVSGGAIGAAAFRACNVGKSTDDAEGCVKRFAQTDLLAPLLAAWMFEDALARVVPTRWCTTPACGFLSRGAWFEQTMESALPAFRAGLTASPPATHRPYLFLNSTWVESGEPAIASDMRIEWERFRGAKDQLDISGHDLPLGTAAHNAARFPYVNAIGALKTGKQRCNLRAAEPPASVPKAVPAAADDPQAVCGHLADGGYFDNSGGQATLDVLHGLARCLEVRPGDSDAAMFAACLDIGDAKRVWLRAHLLPRVLMIRNSASPAAARAKVCFDVSRPTAEDVDFAPVKGCDALSNAGNYEPQRPICRPRSSLFVDFTGPAVTVLNVSGIGANGQLAEARQTQAVQTLRVSLGASAPLHAASAATAIDLLPDGVRYPLGWHLSPAAVDGMARQAGACKLSRPASAASQPGSASLTQIRSGAIASKPSRSNASASASSS